MAPSSQLILVFAGPEMDRTLVRSLAVTAVVALLPSPAWAEVMDKEPTLARIWSTGLLIGFLGFFAWRRHVVLGTLVTFLAAIFVWSFHWELMDTYVGRAILAEAGRGYVLQAYGAMLVCAALHLAGVAALIKGRRPREAAG